MRWALINSENIVENIIEYDGSKVYKPAQGIELRQVQDWIEIGNNADADKPIPAPEKTEQEKKEMRNSMYKADLSLIASYRIEIKSNPELSFSDYLDDLEDHVKNMS